MRCQVTVVIGNGKRYEFKLLDADLAGMSAERAHDWLRREFDAAGCVPTNPVGKLLLADKILCLAKTQAENSWRAPQEWTRTLLCAAATTVGHSTLTLDLDHHTLEY